MTQALYIPGLLAWVSRDGLAIVPSNRLCLASRKDHSPPNHQIDISSSFFHAPVLRQVAIEVQGV